jgi:DNA-binding PadR family transcriptional regulator
MTDIAERRRLGELEFAVLSLLKRGSSYGAKLCEDVAHGSSRSANNAVYVVLTRLQAKGLVRLALVTPGPPGIRGRPRKYFELTGLGYEAVRHRTRT